MSAATAVIIFVCVSNTCRSPMAEYLLRNKLEKLGIADRYVVKSRSLSTDYEPINSPASAQGVQVLHEDYGIDMTGHRSTLLSANDVSTAKYVIPVKRDLGSHIAHLFPDAKEKTTYFSQDISDPWRAPVGVFRSCCQLIDSQLNQIVNLLENE